MLAERFRTSPRRYDSRVADLHDLSFRLRTFLHLYPWRRVDPTPFAPCRKLTTESKIALVSTAGFVLPGQEPFDPDLRGGDWSFREIPADADPRSLIDTHRSDSFDHHGLHEDPNLGFPLDRMRELAASGRIGSLNRRHLSFMGSITAPGRLMKRSAPAAADLLAADGVDAVLLVPV